MSILNAPAANLPLIGVGQFSFTPYPSASQIMAMLNNVSAQIVRVEVAWSDTEQTLGVYAVLPYVDGLIAAIRASGRSVVIVLDYGNALYPGSGSFSLPPRDAASVTAFANYAAWLTTQYVGPDVWFEVYNEPNNGVFWASASSAAQYAALLSACITKMKAATPSVKILSAGVGQAFSTGSITDQNVFMAAVSTAVGSQMALLTCQTIHPYDNTNGPEALFNFISGYQAGVPYSGPIAITEWGYTASWLGSDENKRSIYTARMIGCAVMAGVSLLTVFCLHDTGTDLTNPEMNFGLHTFAKVPKLAATACKNMQAALAGTVTYDAEKIGAAYRLTLRKANGVVVKIIWTDGAGMSYFEPMNSVASAKDASGYPAWVNFQPGGVGMTLGATVAPIILTGT